MSNYTASAVNIGSAVAVVAAVLTFWVAANQQSSRLADSVEDVRSSVSEVSRAAQGTRDAVMLLSGKVEQLASSTDRNMRYLETLDERLRAIETRAGK
tara:strand:+ start:52919 stop:53212 length:294 start_codon:yes stop_codon:yes gene_type:complete